MGPLPYQRALAMELLGPTSFRNLSDVVVSPTIHAFFQQRLIKYILCARYNAQWWGYSGGKGHDGLYNLMENIFWDRCRVLCNPNALVMIFLLCSWISKGLLAPAQDRQPCFIFISSLDVSPPKREPFLLGIFVNGSSRVKK